jgi:hypothetical protein
LLVAVGYASSLLIAVGYASSLLIAVGYASSKPRTLSTVPESLHSGSLAPDNTSLAFLGALYDSLLPSFPHTHSINVGLDETFDLGTGRSRLQSHCMFVCDLETLHDMI